VGFAATIRVDQGSESVSRELDLWAYWRGVTLDVSGKHSSQSFGASQTTKRRRFNFTPKANTLQFNPRTKPSMLKDARALIVVVALAVPAFYITGQVAGPFISRREFEFWRNAWFAVTVAAFLSIQFFAFAVVVVLVCAYVRSAQAAPAGIFFVLLFAVPLVDVPIGGAAGINLLLNLNNARLLAIFLLLPILFANLAAVEYWGRRAKARLSSPEMRLALFHEGPASFAKILRVHARGADRPSDRNNGAYLAPDWLVVSYALLVMGLEFRRAELTTVLRVGATNALDILIPYFAFSRAITNISEFRRVLFGFVIAVLPIALIAPFELVKGWHLYGAIANDWGAGRVYVWRDGFLRAEGPANGAIILGYLFMVSIGCMLGIWREMMARRRFAILILVFLSAGLIASLSRGPWVGCMVLVVAFLASGPNAFLNLGKLAVVSGVALIPLLLLPGGQRLLNLLPFMGSVEVATVTYRQQLFENALLVIDRNLWFGSVDYLSAPEMQALLQGEGIIDTVNTYLEIALNFGVVGLSLFVGLFAVILMHLWRVAKSDAHNKLELGNCARALIATLLAIIVTIGTVSNIDYIPYVYWSFAGLCVAFLRFASRQRVNQGSARRQVGSLDQAPGRSRLQAPRLDTLNVDSDRIARST
jgi:O-antigen ligase